MPTTKKIFTDSSSSGSSCGPRDEGRPIDYIRYKTTLCRTFQAKGHCPYETRCMFAHGQHDLRTRRQNEHEKLTTQNAVKQQQSHLAKAVPTPLGDTALPSIKLPLAPEPSKHEVPVPMEPVELQEVQEEYQPATIVPMIAPCSCAWCTGCYCAACMAIPHQDMPIPHQDIGAPAPPFYTHAPYSSYAA